MRKTLFRFCLPLALLGTLLGCGNSTDSIEASTATETTAEAPEESGESIVLGDISGNPTRKIERYQPLADYLATKLQEQGIGQGKVKIAPDIETMTLWLESGEVDLYFDSPFPAMLVQKNAAAKPLLRRWKKGQAEYNTVFFARNDSGIASIEDLQGKILAIDEPESTTGFMLPIGFLVQSGFQVVEKASVNAKPEPETIGYIFSGDDENTVEWVISQEVAAGAIDNRTFNKLSQEVQDSMVVFAETDVVPRNLTMAAPDLSEAFISEIKEVLVNMDETPEGQEVLELFEDTTKFDELPDQSAIEKMENLYELVEAQNQ